MLIFMVMWTQFVLEGEIKRAHDGGVVRLVRTKPKFLAIYNTLFNEIQIGKYPKGQVMPSEKELCERFGVSRVTVRQAIKILVEDGMIKSIRGKGHVVLPQTGDVQRASSIEAFQHPLDQMAVARMHLVFMNYRIDLASEYTNALFPTHPKALVAMERYYQRENQKATIADAFCFTFVPFHVIDTLNIQLKEEAAITEFVEKTIYERAAQSDLKVMTTEVPHFNHGDISFDGGEHCWLLVETIYAKDSNPVMMNKWYMPQAQANIVISRIRRKEV